MHRILNCICLTLLPVIAQLTGLAQLWAQSPQDAVPPRPALVILTDIGGDPDDQQSLIRLLLYSNELDLRLLIASAAEIGRAHV